MTFSHIESCAVAMPCHECGKFAYGGMHRARDGHWYGPECCPDCRPAEPLPEREIATTDGEQGDLFGVHGE